MRMMPSRSAEISTISIESNMSKSDKYVRLARTISHFPKLSKPNVSPSRAKYPSQRYPSFRVRLSPTSLLADELRNICSMGSIQPLQFHKEIKPKKNIVVHRCKASALQLQEWSEVQFFYNKQRERVYVASNATDSKIRRPPLSNVHSSYTLTDPYRRFRKIPSKSLLDLNYLGISKNERQDMLEQAQQDDREKPKVAKIPEDYA
ncbi:hypothetical protein K435DRAFT_915301 [Dendrothele bispora CBS 962.96]|uniref:Uncharacterized protein n=1 Tax=Dendrothele bispora (strain CBS 962.96) TaxID=1314807 RepID=A0A4S8LJ94_DENBC|nr:hypothetical protein K435DRAFT_915301 [Dendrothele bispora CBS 962.96]